MYIYNEHQREVAVHDMPMLFLSPGAAQSASVKITFSFRIQAWMFFYDYVWEWMIFPL